MERYHRVLLDVWREACRHIEISVATSTITGLLVRDLPVRHVLVRRVDLAHSLLETVAVGTVDRGRVPTRDRAECTAAQMQRLTAWCAAGRLLRRGDGGAVHGLPSIVPGDVRGDWLAGPLAGSDGNTGILILVAVRGRSFDDSHAQLAQALLEPFSAALENDRRLREMAALREAAEADRRSLLARLGRREIVQAIVGADAGLRHVLERVDVVSRSDVPVLLLGETGTGKEVVARAIHARSPRHEGPFIRVNCGAIPSELIDSQLFGHERGSFTGAVDTHKGWFERADGGTLFLDEIGELTPAAQVRLLRVLQDGFIERVGGRQSIHVDVRVVAATHRDLAAMVRERGFREDLWYRVAVFPIAIPPVRERPEDIPALACHFAEKAATRFGLPLVMPTPEDMRLLSNYAWPGNVRELAAVIDRAALLGNGQRLEVGAALGSGLILAPMSGGAAEAVEAAKSEASAPAAVSVTEEGVEPSRPLNDVVREHIEAVLRETYGRIEGPFGAARRLGVNPNTLRARMRRLGLEWRRYRQDQATAT